VPRYLADTSIWSWANKHERPDIKAKLVQRVAADEIVTCVPVALEVMHRADSTEKYEQLFNDLLDPLDWLPLTEEASWRAIEVQRGLAATSNGAHRRSPNDLFIAAIAEMHEDIVLWAFDTDSRVLAGFTDQTVELEESTGPGHEATGWPQPGASVSS
jgi:predicted nucleic acid-binding protein